VKVFKFGGASIKDAAAIRNIGDILKGYQNDSLLIVVSAMGKTTNALEKVVRSYVDQDGQAFEHLNTVKKAHYEIIENLFEGAVQQEVSINVNDAFVEIEWVLEEEPIDPYDYIYDQIVSVGELVSSKVVAAYLNQNALPTHWLDARDVILTDNVFRAGRIQWEDTQERANRLAKPLLESGGFTITQGFIGSTSENFTTTLGREGSDYTAAIFSYCLDAESMSIWKDVPGVLTADPRKFDDVTKLDALSYREAIEMTYYGAKVIHPKTIKPIQNKNIPLYVKSFVEPSGSGTCISSEANDLYPPMIAIEENQALLNISTKDFSFVAEEHISFLFNIIAELRIQVNMMQNTAISFSMSVNDADDKVNQFVARAGEQFKIRIEKNLEIITIRHFNKIIVEHLQEDKIVLLEEKIRNTIKMVVKKVNTPKRKA